MELHQLTAISPVDGRYRRLTHSLDAYFSEFALIKYRVKVEVEYFIALCEISLPQLKSVDKSTYPRLRAIYSEFSLEDASRIKEIEKTTNHDVKAVEYFLKEKMEKLGLGASLEFIHFGITSQENNNTSIPLSLKDGAKMRFQSCATERFMGRESIFDFDTSKIDDDAQFVFEVIS